MTITKQRVEEIISRIEMYGHGAGYTADEVYDLAVLALNLSNIAKLKRYELDMSGCDSCGQDCGADINEDPDGEFVMFDDVVRMVQFDTTNQQFESLAKSEQLPVHINYQCALLGAQFSGDIEMTRHQRRRYTTGAKIFLAVYVLALVAAIAGVLHYV